MAEDYHGGKYWTHRPESVRPEREEASPPPSPSLPKPPPDTANKPDSLGDNDVSKKAKKEYTSSENNLLTATANITPNPKLKAKQTILIDGIGSHLSGLYYIERVTHTFDSSGYSQSIEVSKNGVIDGMKAPKQSNTSKPTPQQVNPPISQNIHKFKQGDTLWDLSVKYYGVGSRWVDIAKANNIDTNGGERRISVGTEIKIPS